MSVEQIGEKNKKRKLGLLLAIIGIPVLLVLSWRFAGRNYYLCSLMVIILAIVPFFMKFEKRRPQARELVTLAVLCAIAVASRAAFAIIPHFKPMAAIIMIAGMAFGAEAGFLVGAISAFASNFIFGQGMWTPWQMFAYGIAGLLAGIFYRYGVIGEKKGKQRIITAVFGFLVIVVMVGPILDICSIFTMGNAISWEWAGALFLSGLPVNIIHGIATAATLFLLCKPMMEKLNRVKIKYGMMNGD